jgi:threonine/homoserine/homoserine lactone efflux protein
MEFLLKGIILGFCIAAPVGPIGLLCIRRTLLEGKFSGFISGLGAATADTFYSLVAAFGITLISGFLLSHQVAIRLIGTVFLFALAVKIFRSQPSDFSESETEHFSIAKAYFSTLFLTLTNPTTIITFLAIFAGVGLGIGKNYVNATLIVTGVFIGSAAWWFILAHLANLWKRRINRRQMEWINRISAGLILLLAVLVIISLRSAGK